MNLNNMIKEYNFIRKGLKPRHEDWKKVYDKICHIISQDYIKTREKDFLQGEVFIAHTDIGEDKLPAIIASYKVDNGKTIKVTKLYDENKVPYEASVADPKDLVQKIKKIFGKNFCIQISK